MYDKSDDPRYKNSCINKTILIFFGIMGIIIIIIAITKNINESKKDEFKEYTEKDENERILTLLKTNNSDNRKTILNYLIGDSTTIFNGKTLQNFKEGKIKKDKRGYYYLLYNKETEIKAHINPIYENKKIKKMELIFYYDGDKLDGDLISTNLIVIYNGKYKVIKFQIDPKLIIMMTPGIVVEIIHDIRNKKIILSYLKNEDAIKKYEDIEKVKKPDNNGNDI